MKVPRADQTSRVTQTKLHSAYFERLTGPWLVPLGTTSTSWTVSQGGQEGTSENFNIITSHSEGHTVTGRTHFILLHFAVLHFMDVMFFTNWKKPSISKEIPTRFIGTLAVLGRSGTEPMISPRSACVGRYRWTLPNVLAKRSWFANCLFGVGTIIFTDYYVNDSLVLLWLFIWTFHNTQIVVSLKKG